jgi:alkylated DNA repair protein (DNA oxidative demethylase)
MTTPWGAVMSVAMTNCGEAGWLSAPATATTGSTRNRPAVAGHAGVLPGAGNERREGRRLPGFRAACLINRYAPGTRLTLHRDRDERDYAHPTVSVSLGLPATFQFGGLKRSDRVQKLVLRHGDVVVWGGPSRLFYHGVAELKDGEHALLGRRRINLTFRRAL